MRCSLHANMSPVAAMRRQAAHSALPDAAGHCGPVYGLTRNPFYPKFFLSAGDWSVRVWNEDLRTPVITSRFMPAHLTSCRWSPSRRALMPVLTTSAEIRGLRRSLAAVLTCGVEQH